MITIQELLRFGSANTCWSVLEDMRYREAAHPDDLRLALINALKCIEALQREVSQLRLTRREDVILGESITIEVSASGSEQQPGLLPGH